MERQYKTMDGNQAAAHVAYAFTEAAAIYPITPSSPMADHMDQWSADGRQNLFGSTVRVSELQSEAGAAGTVHGSLAAGALTTTFTSSQGLLLMLPNLYKMAGELLPCVVHVAARSIATHALSIFGDHSDVYACRQSGCAMLFESNPQEVMDLSAVAHLAAIDGSLPFLNVFDGFRTSHEIQKIGIWDYSQLASLCNFDAIDTFRKRSLNPERPTMRGSHENDDIFFQHREAANRHYDRLPMIVEGHMNKINALLGTDYRLFNYVGAPDAERVIVAMGSVCDAVEEVVKHLTAKGEKVGLIKVRLYRPFSASHLLSALPDTVKDVAVLDRTKEPGAEGEPLYLEVAASLKKAGRDARVIGGRYGLSSKDTPPSAIFAVFEEMKKESPRSPFTIGIRDDVTHLSLDESEAPITVPEGTKECKFWGVGGDGTVGANKNSIKIIGDHTDLFVQAYFQYDSKKTGGVTVSHLRFGPSPIQSPYYVRKADFVACHNPMYVVKGYPMVTDLKKGGVFLINCPWTPEELDAHMPAVAKRYIAENEIRLYTVNAVGIAENIGMGKRVNTILQSAFFALAGLMDGEEAIRYMKEAATASYWNKGQDVVERNHKAIDLGASALTKIEIPSHWAEAGDGEISPCHLKTEPLNAMIDTATKPIVRMGGNDLPVSVFTDHEDGTFLLGASAYEKRGIAVTVPSWIEETCIKCNRCAFACPHATIRPFALTHEEREKAPSHLKTSPTPLGKTDYAYTIAVSPLDCMGCGVCISLCPTDSLKPVLRETQEHQQEVFDYCVGSVKEKKEIATTANLVSTVFKKPLLEFPASCAGCAETSYARLITQLFGDRMYIANATGCSSIWGGPAAACPYTVTQEGRGPAWGNSLFEDNAEYGYGLYLGQKLLRERLAEQVKALSEESGDDAFRQTVREYFESFYDREKNGVSTEKLIGELERLASDGNKKADEILGQKEYLAKKSMWIFGGDGWAYDIGFSGLDHVLASGEDVNVMVFDTEVYSNTGGQTSKASRLGQIARFSSEGKEMGKKNLGEMMMTYGYVYVAQIAMGADANQTMKALKEAEAYRGPSLIIAYSPCELHHIKGGMINSQKEMKKAVECGYWTLYRFNPALKEEGKNPFSLDSKEPKGDFRDFLMGESRFSALMRSAPERAEELFERAEKEAKATRSHFEKVQKLYEVSEG